MYVCVFVCVTEFFIVSMLCSVCSLCVREAISSYTEYTLWAGKLYFDA